MIRLPLTKRRALTLAAVTLLATVVAIVALHNVAILMQAERVVEDIRTAAMLPAEPQDPNIVIVSINEDTLTQFPYRSPIDRAFLSSLLTTLEQRKPRVIGLDVLFDQATEPAKDAALKQEIAGLGVPLVISYTDNPHIVDDKQRAYLDAFVPVALRGEADVDTDPVDGVVRWINPGDQQPNGPYIPGDARALAGKVGITTPALPIEMVWHGSPDKDTEPFRIFPAQLVPILPATWFADKIVLIGEIVSLDDRHRTPFTTVYPGNKGNLPGIEIIAHQVSQLVDGRRSGHIGWPAEIGLVGLLAVVGAAIGLRHRGLPRTLLLGTVTLVALWAGGFALYHANGVMTPLVEPSLAFLMATAGADAVTGRDARRQRDFIQGAFSRYLNPQFVKQLSNEPERLKLGGDMREMTLMFCDIRGFTTISEGLDAQGLTRFINRFLTPMTDAILAAGGTIDKYMGDCVMAFWNAPLDDRQHADHACRAALAMRGELVRLNDALRAEAETEGQSFKPVRFGIGLNTGICCVGNMGSDQRFDYSVLGDNVNLCSRLEGQTKAYGVDIIIGDKTREEAPVFAALEIDLIRVMGKTKPIRIYALLGDEQMATNPTFAALARDHGALIAAYRAQNWAEAHARLGACRAEAPELIQSFYDHYEERIRRFESEPPSADWDGVYVALAK